MFLFWLRDVANLATGSNDRSYVRSDAVTRSF